MEKLFLIILGIISIAGLVLAINNTMKLSSSEWVCIAQQCTSYATGEEWVNQNCKLDMDINEMICEFKYGEESFRVPLKGINVSNMISCEEYECSSKVLISYSK